jgi:hypothetical protein
VAEFGVRAGGRGGDRGSAPPAGGDVAVIAPVNVLDALVDDLVGEVV